ncbi:MAG: hypothetical protein IH886_15315 [Nitrospinae bacterium]|nr:hypothetical protein [Nitrospinota bacterium]
MANIFYLGENMSNLPDYLKQGEPARLIPVASDKEVGAVSIVLSIIQSVPPFAEALMSSIGQRVGIRSKTECFTEVVFKKSPLNTEIRPDGLLIIKVGNRSWKAIIEAKVGNQQIEENQIINYCQLAKQNGIDTIITLSNQFAALPTHHPLKLNKRATSGINVYHWSWMYIITQAQLTLADNDFKIPEQRYLLEEMIKYFGHEKVPVSSFARMNKEWADLVTMVQRHATLNKTSPEVQNSVAAWHQEQKDICLKLSRDIGHHVTLKLSRKHLVDQEQRLLDDSRELVESNTLQCILEIPDAASPITIIVDVRGRTVSCEMRVTAPKDKKRSSSRVNWMVGQLKKVKEPGDIIIKAIWPKRASPTQAALSKLREEPTILLSGNDSLLPQYFEVSITRDLAGKFSGPKTFIEQFENAVLNFYKTVGERLQNWISPPPKLKSKLDEPQKEEDHLSKTSEEALESGRDISDDSEGSNLNKITNEETELGDQETSEILETEKNHDQYSDPRSPHIDMSSHQLTKDKTTENTD